MVSYRVFLAVLVALVLSPALGHSDCAAADQARSALEKQLGEERQQLATLQKTHESAVAKLKGEVSKLQGELTSIKAEKQAEVQRLTAAVAKLKQQTDSMKAELSVADIVTRVAKSTAETYATKLAYAAHLAEVFKQIVMGLQKGNTTQLNLSIQRATLLVGNSVRAFSAFVSRELDEHLPAAKEYAAQASAQAGALYQKHVANATWVAEVAKHLNSANSELKALLTAQIKSQPVLATLDDPVLIQVLAYLLIAAPVLLLFLPALLWISNQVAPSSKANASAKSSKKKKSAKSTAGPAAASKAAPGSKATPSKPKA